MSSIRQSSFARGEITDDLYGRVDQQLYSISVHTARNWIPGRFGQMDNRPGSQFLGLVKNSGSQVRLIPFVFSQSQSYVLEFGNLYIRFWKNGAQITETAKNLTGLTSASPGVFTSVAHGFSNGDEILLASLPGIPQLNGRNVIVANVTPNTFTVKDNITSANISTTTFPAYTSGGTASRIYSVVTPYVTADLQSINFAQSADVITLVHKTYPPADLTRTSDASWAYAVTLFRPNRVGVQGAFVTAGAGGAITYRYKISAIHPTTGEESIPDDYTTGTLGGTYPSNFERSATVIGITQANPAVVQTFAAHGYQEGDLVTLFLVGGMTQVNNVTYTIHIVDATHFTLVGVDSSAYTAYTAGGSASRPYAACISADPTAAAPNVLTWIASGTGTLQYNVYGSIGGVYGLLATVSDPQASSVSSHTVSFSDIGAPPDTTKSCQIWAPIFAAAGDYPGVVAYYQQRRCYASTTNAATTGWMSTPGYFTNFTTRFPQTATDYIKFTLSSAEVNSIMGMVDLRKLLVFTVGGEWSVDGSSGGAVSAITGVDARQSSYNGSSTLRPLVVNANGLYVQTQTSMVRDIIWSFQSDNYAGEERSMYSNHLVQGYSVNDWAYQKVPYSIVWAVRSDGTMLSYTYLREQEVYGWARHDWLGSVTGTAGNMTTTAATVENVCAIPEGTETSVYFTVKRTINGSTIRCVERLQSRLVSSLLDCAYMDARLSYDGRTGGTTTSRITGLWHLIGQSVSVIADGTVISNPLDATYAALTVAADGSLTLPVTAQVVHVGLPFVSDLETHDPEIMESETLINKRMEINSVSLFLKKTLGLLVGRGGPPADTSQSGLSRVSVVDSDDNLPAAGATFTGKVTTPIEAAWDNKGRVLVRQIDPLPATILSLAINGNFPTRQKGT